MRLSGRLAAALRRLIGLRPVDRSLDEELDSYLQHDVDARVEAGMAPAEARRTALADFGGVCRVKERVRERSGSLWLESASQDLRYGVRTLAKSPGFSLTVIGSLSVGIAVNVAVFAFINALFFSPLPGVPDPDQIVQVRQSEACSRRPGCWFPGSYDRYLTLRDQLNGLQLASISTQTVVATLPEPRPVSAAFVSSNYFDVLGVRPIAGRAFTPADAQAAGARVAIISYGLWTRQFGADRAAVGRWIRIATEDFQIVGIAPKAFNGVSRRLATLSDGTRVDLWLPMPAIDLVVSQQSLTSRGQRDPYSVMLIGRTKPGRDLRQIESETEVAIARMAEAERQTAATPIVDVDLTDPSGNRTRVKAAVIGVIAPVPMLILALACLNAANVLLARASRRGREIAVRLAIGASRWRIVRQLLTESLLLAVTASALALPMAWWGLKVAGSLLNLEMPIDGSVLMVTVLIAAASALAFGLAPAVRASTQPARALGSPYSGGDTPPRSRARAAMVVVEVALSMGLLATGVQLVATFESQFRRAGVAPDRLVIASFDLDHLKFSPIEAEAFYSQLVDGASKLPQAAGAGLGPFLWTRGRAGTTDDVSVVGWRATDTPRDGKVYRGGHVSRGLFEAVGLRVVDGRGFSTDDHLARPPQVALINRQFAKTLSGGALGQVIRVAPRRLPYAASTEVRIVGIVESAADPGYARADEAMAAVYVPSPLQPETGRVLYVQSRGSAGEVMSAVRALVQRIDARVPVADLSTLEQFNERATPGYWLARAAAFLGLIALGLTTIGVYGVISYIVGLRVQEFAVRLSLGATPGRILHMVVGETLILAAAGFLFGLLVALAMSPLVQEERMTTAIDLTGLAGSLALSLVAVFCASAVPALRAARVDPITVLKAE